MEEKRMKREQSRIRNIAVSLIALFLAAMLSTVAPVYAANWASLSGAETLRAFVSGARVEI